MSELWRKLASFFRRERLDRELEEEIESHLEMQAEEHREAGMEAAEARYAARRQFGNVTLLKETSREAWGWGWLEMVGQDLKFAIRTLRKNPGFTATAALTLALGIGANTTMFSVIHAVLLRPLPYPEPSELVRVAQKVTNAELSIAEYEFWKEHSTAFSSVAGCRSGGERRLVSGTAQEWIRVMTVTTDFLRTLGINPALGREFNPKETHAGGPQAIILTGSLWRRSLGADPHVLGRGVTLDDASYTVVGVLPPSFWFPQSVDALVPLRPTGSLDDLGMNTEVIARLKAGFSLRQAEAEMATVTESYRRAYAGRLARNYRGLTVVPYQGWLVGDVRLNLVLLFGATGLLLLIACSNLASLLLARLAGRTKEIAVRLALGSGRGRLLRQFLIENLLLATMGMLVGLLGAYGLLDGLVALIPFDLPASTPIRVDNTVLTFALAVALGTGLAFTFVPFFTAARLNLPEALKEASRTAGTGTARRRTRNFLVVTEVALSATLLIAAGLLIQTLYRLHQERFGFTVRGLMTFETPLAADRHRTPAALSAFVSTMLERLQALPGARSVAATNLLPLTGWSNLPTQREGHPGQSIGGMEIRLVTPAYFEVMGIPLRRGRSFTRGDAGASPPVALVNETLARSWWPRGDAVGDRLIIGRFHEQEFLSNSPREVIGIVADTKTTTLKDPPRPTVFIPVAQGSDGLGVGSLAWIVSSSGTTGVADELRHAVAEIDSRQRLRRLRTMDQIVASTTATSRFDAWLFGIFAGLALALAAIGVYGLLAFSVAQRRQEIGIRMALGASRADVSRVVLKQGLALTMIGLGLGLAGALFITRWLSSLLWGVRPNDPFSFVAVSLLLLTVGLIASYVPARRAAKVDPMEALRYE